MFKNYLLVAFRNIRKHKFYSFINIFGLTTGLAACLLIGMYVTDELGYDKLHKNGENIYRLALHGRVNGQEILTSNSSSPVAPAMIREIPGVESALRLRGVGDIVFKYDDKAFSEDQVYFADSNFFEFFTFPLEQGDFETVLDEPNTIVLTTELAQKYFGDEDALGQLITIGNDETAYKVTGVSRKAPGNSHIKFGAILSMKSMQARLNQEGWVSNSLWTYYLKDQNTDVEGIDAKLAELTRIHVGEELQQFMGVSFDEFVEQGGQYGYYSFPLLDTHLRAGFDDDVEPGGDISYVYIFTAIGVFILLIACINFMNLSTARSAGRAKEVGLRKTLGSFRRGLIWQFLSESVIFSLIASVLALLLAYLSLPFFNTIAGKNLLFSDYLSPVFAFGVLSVALIVGLLAGSYPAFYLTSFKPVEVLGGKLKSGMKSRGVRSVLVIFQFWISIILIVCTTVVYNQLSYMQNKDIGFDKHNVLVVQNAFRLDNNMFPYKNALDEQTNIKSTSYTNNVFPGVNNTTVFKDAQSEMDHMMGSYFGDFDHLDVLNFEIVMGRNFSRDFASDSSAVLINESAYKEMGWKDIEGKEILTFFGDNPEAKLVIGVIKDFNFESLKDNIRPIVINLTERGNNLLVRYEGSSKEAVEIAENIWKEQSAGETFEYEFLDQNYDTLFRAEERLGTIFTLFTSLAIFIACLGLFGLASFTAEQRTKEIGIRKVMGASVTTLTAIMSKDFTILVGISFLLAVVPSYYFMDKWLNSFAYREELGIWVFAGAGLLTLVIAWLTVSFQAIKAAVANPVKSLKYE